MVMVADDPAEDEFYAILKTHSRYPDSSTDTIIEHCINGLGVANARARVLQDELSQAERYIGIRYYTLPYPVHRP
jgi:hypothetical protein